MADVQVVGHAEEEVADLVLDSARGVKVRDVASVRLRDADAETFSRLNGDPVVLLVVHKTSGSNVVEVGEEVHCAIAGLSLPTGYRARVAFDTTKFTRATMHDTFVESLMTALIVSFIILVFIGRSNSALSVILAIPVTLAGSVVVYGLFGFTFNVISLLALIVAVVLVVDDAIVVAENIDRWLEMGHERMDAVIKGASEVSTAVLATTLSLLAVFVPMSFLPGVVGQLFREFAIGLSTAIAISYLEAMFFLTVRLAYFPDPKPPGLREVPRVLRELTVSLLRWRVPWRAPLFWAFVAGVGLLAGRAYASAGPGVAVAVAAALLYPPLAFAARAWLALLGVLMLALHELLDRRFTALQDAYV